MDADLKEYNITIIINLVRLIRIFNKPCNYT